MPHRLSCDAKRLGYLPNGPVLQRQQDRTRPVRLAVRVRARQHQQLSFLLSCLVAVKSRLQPT